MNKRTTIDDVAREAGVSRQTVSRAINGKHDISEATRKHVLETVDSLNYRPNRLARGMALNSTRTIGLIVGDITNPSHAEVVRGFQDAAQISNYNVFLRNADRDPECEREAIHSLMAEEVDAIVIVASVLEKMELKGFLDQFRPIIFVHRDCQHPNASSIVINIERATNIALEYLIGSGHKNIGLVTTQGNRKNDTLFTEYKRVLTEKLGSCNEGWVAQAEPSVTGGFTAARQLLSKHPEITAIFTYNDIIAVGAIQACRMLGLSVPDDCSILGFTDVAIAGYITPTLSTIRYHTRWLGQCTFERVLEMLDNTTAVFPQLVLETELVIRESTGPNRHATA